MKTVALCSQKGGPGKTTLGLNLGVEAELAGHTTLIIDLDPQASASKWGDRRENETPVIISTHASRLKNALEAAEKSGVTFCILDTPPNADSTIRDAAKAADLFLIPCRPSMLDVDAMEQTIEIGKNAKSRDENCYECCFGAKFSSRSCERGCRCLFCSLCAVHCW